MKPRTLPLFAEQLDFFGPPETIPAHRLTAKQGALVRAQAVANVLRVFPGSYVGKLKLIRKRCK